METACEARRRDGQPCTLKALPGQRFCFAHSEALRERRRAGNAAGGRNKRSDRRARKMMPDRLEPVFDKVVHAMGEVEGGRMSPRVGTALATLASAAVRVFEPGVMEQRLQALEKELAPNARAG